MKEYSAPPPLTIDPNKNYSATFKTSRGDIVCDLFAKDAPKTAVRGSELYGGSGFREKTLRWEIATSGCRSRAIGDTPRESVVERSEHT